jgi:xanthine dehydrogenase accessory factor
MSTMLESDAVLERAASLKAAGQSFALVTVVRSEASTSAKPGAKAVVEADGVIQGWIGGGCAQPAVIKTVQKALKDGQSRLIRISPEKNEAIEEGIIDFGMTCHSGGTLDIFIDPIIARPMLLIIGGSPAAQSLSALAQRVGFDVTAAFPGAGNEMFPDAVEILDSLEAKVMGRVLPSFVVVATQGKRDEEGLEAALASGANYIAFIASERKAQKLRQYLLERGHDKARVEAILSPAGIGIDAVTPEEIALSVVAGLVQARRSGKVTPPEALAGETAASVEAAVEEEVAEEAIDPVCGMSVAVATAEHRSEYNGKHYYFCCAGCQHSFEKEPEKYL